MGMGVKGQHQGFNVTDERYMLERNHNSRREVKYHKHPEEENEKQKAERQKAREKATKDDGDAHARTTTTDADDDHNDIPPKLSPAFSTSLSSPSLLALGKGRKIGLASNPMVMARIVGLDIPGEPITGLENAKFGWVKDCI
jgi:hypothetical protein